MKRVLLRIDTPLILQLPDAGVPGHLADAVILVFRAGVTPQQALGERFSTAFCYFSDTTFRGTAESKYSGVLRIIVRFRQDCTDQTDGQLREL